MPPRRAQTSSNTLSPQDNTEPASLGFPRSTSPSNGFTQFLSRPSKWFGRSASNPRMTSTAAGSTSEPRASSSSGRKHKISRPTDPRPILDSYSTAPGARSVMDLSSSRNPNSLDLSRIPFNNASQPSSPSSPFRPGGLGDLRAISKRAWSRSADDLTNMSTETLPAMGEKIAQYRNRSNSNVMRNNGPPSAPPTVPQPFPSMPTVSVSTSAPILNERPPSPHVHTRSHSFTPKLASKLSAPLFPVSPKRKGSAGSELETPPVPSRGAYPFSASIPSPTTHRSTTLLAPPSIVEPSDDQRSSQIVYNSGFINKFADGTANLHQANLGPVKAWKPFKLELKGSKLYFYKPPSDRAAEVKELFPMELVPASMQDDVEQVEGEGEDDPFSSVRSPRQDNSVAQRKRRAFWGRRTHPDLSRDADGNIERGTFEALTHEAVFGTTFDEALEQWKEFAASVLLSLPHLVEQATFEAELMRCCKYLVTGAEAEEEEEEKQRVVWLVQEYLQYHDRELDFPDWPEWKSEIAPERSTPATYLPRSDSTRAIFNPTPVASPNIGMFSPRPGDIRPLSLSDALNGGQPNTKPTLAFLDINSAPPTPASGYFPNTVPWASALDREGLSRDVLLLIDPETIARSLTAFHVAALQQLPESLTADFILKPEGSEPSASTSSPNSLFSASTAPSSAPKTTHTGSLNCCYRRSDDRTYATSRTHSRSEVISAWIKIGEQCRLSGDECSWRAILLALCSAPVARLEKAWKRVDSGGIATVESWVQPDNSNNKGQGGIKEPREELSKALVPAPSGIGDVVVVGALTRVRVLFEEFRTCVSLCPRGTMLEDDDAVKKLAVYWNDILADGGSRGGSLAMKFQRVDQFISLSLAAEPKRKGLYEPFYWHKSSGQSLTAPLLPLLFPEPLPTITLLDRSQLLRGRVDSDATDIQHLRAVDGHLRAEDRRQTNQQGADGILASLNQKGTTIPVYNGDLLLVVQNPSVESSSTGSRPSSLVRSRPPSTADMDASLFLDGKSDLNAIGRTPSIRVTPRSSANLERKSSVARRNSLPSLSQRQHPTLSENSSEPPLRVLVQAGTLDRLVDILVQGLHNVSVSVADDNGEMSLRVGMTRELLLDHKEFTRVWWNVFRSFVTPLIFFELLRKIYLKSQPIGSPPLPDQYLTAISVKSQVLETVKLWLTKGGGAQDILDDSQLLQALRAFFSSSSDHTILHASPPTMFEDSSVRQAWDSLTESRQVVEQILCSQTMRPSIPRNHISRSTVTTSESRMRNLSTREPPDMDRMSPEEFVDNIDGMAFAAFNNVTEEDLYITSDLLEVQSADRTGWFLPREITALEDHIEIQTIHTHIQEVEPSSLISELSPESLYRLLPPGIRSCIRAHSIVRKWIVSKVVAPRLGLRTRQARLEFLLQVIEVARLRNAESLTPTSVSEQPCVRSFVEAAVTSAILSPECRMHQRAWQNIAAARGCNYETLAQLLARPMTEGISSKEALTVDMGWLIERILDVIAMPDLVESQNEEGQSLVNFDKRRNLCNFISNAPSLLSRRFAHQNDINRRGFERLNNIEREIFSIQFDLRGIKDEAYRESTTGNITGTPSRKISRPLQRLVAFQVEKHRRDKNLRVRLQKEKLLEQSRNEKREEQLNRAMKGGRRPSSIVQKQHRNKKSMSALFSFMRPISSAFGADSSHAPTLKRTASELDFVPSGKPTLVLNLSDSTVSQFINNDRSFTFQLNTEDGGHYLLQAMSKREMIKWIETLAKISKTAAKRRLTYLGNSPGPQAADHIHDHPTTASRDPKAVFGVELDFLLERENGGGPISPGTIPSIIKHCLAQVESRGLTEVGIYRMAGASSEIAHLKEAFNRGDNPLDSSTDIHAVCDLIKSWFRVLPEPLFPPSLYHESIQIIKLENLDERLSNLRRIVEDLPRPNFDLLKLISEHLDRVTDYEEQNQMTAEALAIVFSPNLMRAPQNDFLMVLANMPYTHKLVKTLITHYHVIFDDTDAEAEAEAEDELDTAIAEVDSVEDDEGEFTNYIPTSPS
ncbi:hypothetical protein BDP27DRAFT_1337062 [Rhodocollybia butyracea]|uniref:Uncharacterized protein n=1 Tax=Rhodocollybia butyracea TaxID=206335 RepID=A0A9P5PAT0_9AGAR|nr:hypothetical protein BDP27DRAFT_1337062 [Rhodocollybia butyracea]